MSVTEELRRLLDERGVEWAVTDESWNQDSITYWKVGSIKWVAFESENGTLWLNCNSVTDLTPEQAIAATVGRGMCELEINTDMTAVKCSKCGYVVPKGTDLMSVKYCAGCGRKVVE